VWTLSFPDWPAAGQLTAFTWGLSAVTHERWRAGRPELVISLLSRRLEWALLLGEIVRRDRGRLAFSYGDIIEFDEPLASETEMTAFLIFMPVDIEPQWTHIELVDRIVNLVQLYPIHHSEIDLIRKQGPRDFLMRDDLNHLDIRRKPMAAVEA